MNKQRNINYTYELQFSMSLVLVQRRHACADQLGALKSDLVHVVTVSNTFRTWGREKNKPAYLEFRDPFV